MSKGYIILFPSKLHFKGKKKTTAHFFYLFSFWCNKAVNRGELFDIQTTKFGFTVGLSTPRLEGFQVLGVKTLLLLTVDNTRPNSEYCQLYEKAVPRNSLRASLINTCVFQWK